MTQVSNSGKVSGSDSGKESGTISDKDLSVRVKTRVRRLGKTKCAGQGDFFALGSIRVEGGDLKESEPRSTGQEEDQIIRFKFKD
jgi:hypothetical protein